MRKLVTIRKIDSLAPIPDADAIECAILDGWTVVVKKGEFVAGQKVFFFEVDSVLPIKSQFEFLRKSCYVKNDLIEGFRLKTVRLRGQISQGLVLPLDEFEINELDDCLYFHDKPLGPEAYDSDWSEFMGVVKWEPPVPAQMSGQVKGNFPSLIQKTDQERANNFSRYIFEEWADHSYEVTMKLDGSSMTVYNIGGDTGVCSRNLDLKVSDENADNTFVKFFLESGLKDFMERHGTGLALQGELMGPGVQGNREKLNKHMFYLFNVQLVDRGEFMDADDRLALFEVIKKAGVAIEHVPVLHKDVKISDLGITDFRALMDYAEGPSINHPIREGLVYKSNLDPRISFKTISEQFLLKEK